MYYVYLLKSKVDNRLYLGYFSDLRKRFKEHIEGKARSTKYRLPVELVYYEAYKSKEDAKRREKQLKYFGKAYKQLKNRIQSSINYP